MRLLVFVFLWWAATPCLWARSDGRRPCLNPPTLINGDVKLFMQPVYYHMDRVEMLCQAYHVMEGGPMLTCDDGEWRGDVRCLKPCTVDRDAMNRNNIAFRFSRHDKLYAVHNDSIMFRCTSGRPLGELRQRCENGTIVLPTCQ